MWFVAWLLVLHVLFTIIPSLAALPLVVKFSLGVGLTGFLIAGSYCPLRTVWRGEMAASLEGDLFGAGDEFMDGKSRVAPEVQIGDSESILVMEPSEHPEPYFKPFPDAEFRVELGKKGPLVSTVIRDSEGHTVVSLERNHWRVYPPFCQDKNYTEDALEALDSSGHVIFQLRIPKTRPPRVQVQVEWWDNQGSGLRIMRVPNGNNGIIFRLGSKVKRNESLIPPIFLYPSANHWGEFKTQN